MSTEPNPWDELNEPHEPHEPYEPTKPIPQPDITRLAGILWIVMGIVFFFFGCLNVLTSALLAARQPNRPDTGSQSCAVWLSFGIGTALFVAGRNLRSGKAKDVLVSSIFSILLGLFYAALGVGAVLLFARDEVMAVILGGMSFIIALGCCVPGILALVGRSRYLEWKRENRRRRRRRRQYDEESEDDREPDEKPWDRGRNGSA